MVSEEVVGEEVVVEDWLVIQETESATAERHSPWVPNIFSWKFLCVIVLWTLAVGHLSGRRQAQIIDEAWKQKVQQNVTESLLQDMKLQEEEELKKMNSSKTEVPELGQVLWTIGVSVGVAAVAGWALWHSDDSRTKAYVSWKQAYEATMTLYYTPEPVKKAPGRFTITHVFTCINAARQAGRTLQSPRLHMKGMETFGRFTFALRMNGDALHKGAVGLGIELSRKPAGAADREGAALMEVKSYTLRLMSLPNLRASGRREMFEKELDPRIATGIPDMLSKEEFESGRWTTDDALVAQVDVVLA